MRPFQSQWGTLPQLEVPFFIFDGSLEADTISPSAIKVLLVLLDRMRNARHEGLVAKRVLHEDIEAATGLSEPTVDAAIKNLQQLRVLQKTSGKESGGRGKNRQARATTNLYTLLNPLMGGSPLEVNVKIGSRALAQNGIRYFTIPRAIVTEGAECIWSLRNLSPNQAKLYCAICFLRRNNKDTLTVAANDLQGLAGSSRMTFKNDLRTLQSLNLIAAEQDRKVLRLALLDPYTGMSLDIPLDDENDPRNLRLTEGGTTRRANINTPERREKLAELFWAAIRDNKLETTNGTQGETLICCPFHAERTPSCSVSFEKACFYCHGGGCSKKTGTLLALVAQITGESVPSLTSKVMGGAEILLARRDVDVEATYDYLNEHGKLVKQVVRYKTLPGEKKDIRQRRWAGGDWVWNTDGVRPTLYNAHYLKYARVVAITEGEKDADTLMRLLGPRSDRYCLIAVTSGNAESWLDSFAQKLTGKRVVIMPDNDTAGQRYLADIRDSLDKRTIEYRIVTFDGCKDVTDFVDSGSGPNDILAKIGVDWIDQERHSDPFRVLPELAEA